MRGHEPLSVRRIQGGRYQVIAGLPGAPPLPVSPGLSRPLALGAKTPK
jgi:hypothetical protein